MCVCVLRGGHTRLRAAGWLCALCARDSYVTGEEAADMQKQLPFIKPYVDVRAALTPLSTFLVCTDSCTTLRA